MATFADINILNHIREHQSYAKFKADNETLYYHIKSSWGGYADSISPTLLPDLFTKGSLNNIGYGSYLEKAPGSEALGQHCSEENCDVKKMRVIQHGHFTDNNGVYHRWKIVSTPQGNKFYVLRDEDKDGKFEGDEVCWLDKTPTDGIGTSQSYNVEEWRGGIYIVSGEEYTVGTNTGCVLAYDPVLNVASGDWQVINTGQGVSGNANSTGNDGSEPFCPTIIEFHDDTMYLAGDPNFCKQVKFSQHGNPYNVTGDGAYPFLGLIDVPATVADLIRPSTFLVDQDAGCINSLNSASGNLVIGTDVYVYGHDRLTILETNSLPAGILWIETLKRHQAAGGTYSQNTIIEDDQFFNYINNNNDYPGFASLVPSFGEDSVENVYVNRSTFVQETFREIDWSRGAIGKLGQGSTGSITFISGSRCGGNKNDTTIAYKIIDGTPVFTEIPYIHASSWDTGVDGTFWGSEDDGNIYKITPDSWRFKSTDSDGSPVCKTYPFIMQLGRAGISPNDLDFSDKELGFIWIAGVSEVNPDVQIDLLKLNTVCGEECSEQTIKVRPCINPYEGDECDCKTYHLKLPYTHQGGTYFATLIDVSGLKIHYNILDIRVSVMSDNYFALHQFGTIYKVHKPIGSKMVTNVLKGNAFPDITYETSSCKRN